MARNTLEQVPYNAHTGHMVTYPTPQSEWRPNTAFEAALRVVGTERGQSAARFIVEDTATGVQYPLFMTELLAIVQHATIEHGVVSGQWIGCKRGANYGIRLHTQENAA
jgi:hypothetical protein